VGVAVMVQ